jgi:hypothetical protein
MDIITIKKLKNVVRFLGAFLISAVIVVIVIEDEAWFKQLVEQNVNRLLSKAYACHFSSRVKKVRLLLGTLEFEDVRVDPCQGNDWWWSCSKLLWVASPWKIVWKGTCPVRLTLESCQGYSRMYQGHVTIIPHLLSLIHRSDGGIPMTVTSLTLRKGQLHLADEYGYEFTTLLRHDIYFLDGYAKTKALLYKGTLHAAGIPIVEHLQGSVEGTLYSDQPLQRSLVQVVLDGKFITTSFPLPLRLQASFSAGHCSAHLGLDSQKGVMAADIEDDQSFSITARLPAALLTTVVTRQHQEDVAGVVTIDMHRNYIGYTQWALLLDGKDIAYGTMVMPAVRLALHNYKDKLQGVCTMKQQQQPIFEGSFSWFHKLANWQVGNEQKKGDQGVFNGVLLKNIPLWGNWFLSTGTVSGKLQDSAHCLGAYAFSLSNKNKEIPLAGKLQVLGNSVTIEGSSKEYEYRAEVGYAPLSCKQAKLSTKDAIIAELVGDMDTSFKGTVSYGVLRALLQEMGIDLPGEGIIEIAGSVSPILQATIAMRDAHIKLPYSYNMVRGLSASLQFDLCKRVLHGENLNIVLHEGEISCAKATLGFDNAYHLIYGHVPLLFKNCFIGWKKDLFSLVSGGMTLSYRARSRPLIEGLLLFDRSHVRGNILSAELQQNLFTDALHPLHGSWADPEFCVQICTRQPLQVKTTFLDALMRVHMNLKGTLSTPELTGSLNFVSGSLEFPYQPLYITSGKLYFLPGRLNDPGIELSARNTIKRFGIGMQVSGSLKQPKISFESSPMLEESQIITLLLGGSEDGSLYTVMPTALMHTIESLLFGPADSSSGLQRYLKNLFKPLKNVRFVPNFNDQSARGGLKGSLVFDINERLRGLVQKNFSLPEDTRVEIEYSLSDDTVVRAVKDERGDAGGEIEARWKF